MRVSERARLQRQREQLEQTASALSQVTVQVQSHDRLVGVTINARGLLTGLRIDPAALRRYRAEQLAAEIADLVATADGRLQEMRNRIASAVVHIDSDGIGSDDGWGTVGAGTT